MFDFSSFENEELASYKYDNIGAYDQLQLMMKRKEILSIKFYNCKIDNTPCAWIQSKTDPGFRYILKQESIDGIIKYLKTGEISDFDRNPNEYETLNENEIIQERILKMFIEEKITIQWKPLFRESLSKISGFSFFKMGKIYFRLDRKEETLDYLRDYKQAI